MAKRKKWRDPFADYIEWTEHRFDPGYYLGGRIPPHLKKAVGRRIGVNHWHHFNDACLAAYAKSGYARLRLETFNADGSRRSRSEIVRELGARRRDHRSVG